MNSLLSGKLSRLAKTVVEKLPIAGDASASALAALPIKALAFVSFKDFIRRISLCESHDEIEAVIQSELERVERLLAAPSADRALRADALSVAVYCHLLGHDVRFIRIHAITLAQQGSLLQKRMGYLAVSLLVRPTDDLAVLLTNTLLGDLRSGHVLVVCTALNAVCHLATADNCAALLPALLDKLGHRQAVVRDKAVRALHSVLQRAPQLLGHHLEAVETALLDRDPTVMASAVQLCLTFAALNPAPFVPLTSSLMTILGQIQSRKLPPDFDHGGLPAPWLQCSLIRLISYLFPEESALMETFAQFLLSQLSAPVPSTTMGFAVLCECVAAVGTLPPHLTAAVPVAEGDGAGDAAPGLQTAALRCADLMVRSADANVRYAGLAALGGLCAVGTVRPSAPLQLAVVQCLRHEDETLRLCALRLLHDVASADSAPAVCARLQQAARGAVRPAVRTLLRWRALRLAETFLSQCPQLISVVNSELSQADCESGVVARLRHRLTVATGASADAGELQIHASAVYARLLLEDEPMSDCLRSMALWAAGQLCTADQADQLVSALSDRLPALAAAEAVWEPPTLQPRGAGWLPEIEPNRSIEPVSTLDPVVPLELERCVSPLLQHLHCLESLAWRCSGALSTVASARLSDAVRPLQRLADPQCASLARSVWRLVDERGGGAAHSGAAATAAALLAGRRQPDFTLSFADDWICRMLDVGAGVMRPPAMDRARVRAPAASGTASPDRSATSPFETLGPLQLPTFMMDDGRSTGSRAWCSAPEPAAVWTLLGRRADAAASPVTSSPTPSSPTMSHGSGATDANGSASAAPMSPPASAAPAADDRLLLQELFPTQGVTDA